MSKGTSFDLDAAGWLFWSVVTLVLLGPAIWLAWKIADPYASRVYPVAVGATGAILAASVVSTVVNYFVQRRHKRQRISERKKAKKHK